MMRQTLPLLAFAAFVAGLAACVPQAFPPVTVGNVNGIILPLGVFFPETNVPVLFNPFFFPVTRGDDLANVNAVTTNTVDFNPATVPNFNSFIVNANRQTQAPPAFNFNGVFDLDFTGVFNLNNAIPPTTTTTVQNTSTP